MPAKNDSRERARFFRDHQLAGGTYKSALEIWNAADEIAEGYENDGLRTADQISDGEIREQVSIWRRLRELKL